MKRALHPSPVLRASRARPRFSALRALACSVLVALVLLTGRRAGAVDRRTEAAAKEAMSQALKDHAAGDDDGGVLRLQKARRACGTNKCSAFVRGALIRDLGALTFLRGEHAKASALFGEALDLVDNLPWNPVFNDAALSGEWSAVKNERAAIHEARIVGDFDHVPVDEQAVDTPVPVYAELSMAGVAKVVVKYKGPGDSEFKRRTLPRFGGGWGGTIPCQDVKRGLLRYFLQAFDADGVPIANSGDVSHLFFVPVRWAINGEPPHLPGQSPPEACNGQVSPEEVVEPAAEPGGGQVARYVHFWFGVSGSADIAFIPSGSDVCAIAGTPPTPVASSFYCTNPGGSDFPARSGAGASPVKGRSGDSPGGPTVGNIRVLFTFDYAVNTHFLTGARFGYVAQSYPGAAASNDGREISTPIHLELRETYLFGNEPLAHAGFAPYGFVAVGYAKTDASENSTAELVNVEGSRPVVVWRIGGPYFAAVGAGARYAFSPRVAFLAGLKGGLAFGPAGTMPTLAPEVELQYGF